MLKKTLLATLILVLAILLVACGGGGDTGGEEAAGGSVGDAAHGEELYNQVTIGSASAPGCVTCHSTEEGVVLVGPSHAGLASRAGTYVEGMSAEDYLRESITDPNAHIVDGFTPDVMYQNFGEELQARDINDLIAYMLTLN
ncbi:MAG: c-type cytochrome [Anaerolineales bacterium]|nr:c-type cytochrome [Anaerolineales bacterium]